AAAWQCDNEQAEMSLNELADQFSFVFAQEIEREPHALVKQFLREHLRDQASLPTAIHKAIDRLIAYFESRMRERERDIWGIEAPSNHSLTDEQRQALEEQREAHQRTLRYLETQIAGYGEMAAPVHLLIQRDGARRAIAEIDAKLAQSANTIFTVDGPRRPL